MPGDRRASRLHLQEQLSGSKRSNPISELLNQSITAEEDEENEQTAIAIKNHRRLSTLYGATPSVKTVVRIGEQNDVGKIGGGKAVVSAMDAAISSSMGAYMNNTSGHSPFSKGSSRNLNNNNENNDFKPSSSNRPQTASAVDRLRNLQANKLPNPLEPAVDRLSRPKSAIGKFRDRPRSSQASSSPAMLANTSSGGGGGGGNNAYYGHHLENSNNLVYTTSDKAAEVHSDR